MCDKSCRCHPAKQDGKFTPINKLDSNVFILFLVGGDKGLGVVGGRGL